MTAIDHETLITRISELLAGEADIVVDIGFGSIARGELRPDSDIDIAVLARTVLTSARRRELIEMLAEASGRSVDLIDLRTAGVVVTRAALSEGERLVCKDENEYVRLVSRMLVDVADFLPYRERMLRERRNAWLSRRPDSKPGA